MCEEIDGQEKAFLNRPLEGDWPHLWIDATYLKVWRGGQIVSVAVILAFGVNTDGRRENLGLETGTSEAEPIWTEFLRKLTLRGLRGVKMVISDAYQGIKAAVSKVLSVTWQRCRVHFQRKTCPCRKERAACRLSIHRDRLCLEHLRGRKRPLARRRRSDPAQGAEVGRPHG